MGDDDLKDRVLSLTNSDLSQNDRLDEIDELIERIRELLEGKPEDRDDNGLKGDIYDLIRRLNKLEAIMAPDHLGEGGIINRLKKVEKKSGFEEKQSENRWKFWIAAVGAVALIIAALIPHLDRIEKFFKPTPIVKPVPQKRPIKRVVKRVPAPPPVSPDDEPEEIAP